MRHVVLVTAGVMPQPEGAPDYTVADGESPLLVDALAARGVHAEIVPWTAAFDWGDADLVVIRSAWDYFERLEEFLGWATDVASATRLVNPIEVLRWNAHKSYMVDLAARGVPTVPTLVVPHGAGDVDLGEVVAGSEVIIKPAVSVGAIGASRVDAADVDLPQRIRQLAEAGDVLVQPFIPSVLDRGEVSLIFVGDEFSHAVRKVPAHGEYRVHEHHGGTVHTHVPTPAELDVAHAALAAAPGACAYARVDLVDGRIDGQSSPLVMELELIEPGLFLTEEPAAADRLARVLAGAAAAPAI